MSFRLIFILIAATLVTAAAFSTNPGSMLIYDWALTYTPGTPPAAGSVPPAQAAAAGFTTQVLNADFTVLGGAWSNPNTYVTNCGAANSVASTPSAWHFNYHNYDLDVGIHGGTQPACSDTAIVTDSVCGCQALDLKMTTADWLNVKPDGAYLSWPAYIGLGPGTTNWLPNEMYTKIVMRTTSAGLTQGAGGVFWGIFDWWSTSQFGTAWADEDTAELGLPTPASLIGQIQSSDHVPVIHDSARIISPTMDVTQYHTIEGLYTSDESTNLEICTWIDGSFIGCAGVGMPQQGGFAYTTHDRSIDMSLALTPTTTSTANNDVDVFIQSIQVWTCPTFATTTCPGTVVDHWPFP